MFKVQKNSKFGFIICIAFIILLLSILCFYFVQTWDYVKVEAQIHSVYTVHYDGNSSEGSSKAHYAVYQFSYDGQTYQAEKQILTKKGVLEGDTVHLYCDPENPHKTANTLVRNICLSGLVLMSALTTMAFRKSRPT